MKAEPRCDPANAPDWLRKLVEDEIGKREEAAKTELVDQIVTCVNDPRQCTCDDIPVRSHRIDCERQKALAIKCEFENDDDACFALEGEAPDSSELPEFLRPTFDATIREAIAKKEKQMFARFAPPECKEAGVTTRQECEAIMIAKYGAPPPECTENGKFIGPKQCEAIMIDKYMPQPCKDAGVTTREACEDIMLPPECKEANARTRESCEALMIEKYLPEPCKQAGATTRESCEAVMRQQVGGGFGEGPGGFPGGAPDYSERIAEETERCKQEGIQAEECRARITEQIRAEVQIPSGEFPGPGGEISGFNLPQGFDVVSGTGPLGAIESSERFGEIGVAFNVEGGAELVNAREFSELRARSEELAQEQIVPSEDIERLRYDITQLQEEREGLREEFVEHPTTEGASQEASEAPSEAPQAAPEPESAPAASETPTGGVVAIINKIGDFLRAG